MPGLQAIKRDADAILVPKCQAAPKSDLWSGTAVIIDGFIVFMRDIGNGKLIATEKFNERRRLLTKYEAAHSACRV